MKVTIDKNSGFCWGVVRTVDIAEEVMKESPELYSLGPIIHNPMETNRLKEKGLETIAHSDFGRLSGKKVLIRAHGEPPSTYALARKNNIELIDATCPVVTKVQERIRKFYDKGYQIVIFGKKDHAEVIGLVGHTNNEALVIKSVEETAMVDPTKKTVLFSQTTMDKPTFYEIARVLKEKIRAEFEVGTFEESALDFHAKDTICGQVSGRDKKLREFASQNDIVIFVAGRNSSNGKVLYEICKEANSNTFFIEEESELKYEWFEGKESVGISGATSTPQWLMEKVKTAIETIASPVNA
ncbi:4-hydroxy-3-methylbut-2-enyl diphosphate reductase [Sphingobacteriales bacterium CHB3]|nr:4-hydroxy-3-methylbut-2-enyl diphosphate reductase [Sphingobacteriales bacterium CHB3]